MADKPTADKAQTAPEAASAAQTPAKVSKGISALTLARIASERLGRKVNDKRVRSVARDTLARFQDGEYTPHAYTPAEASALLATMSAKGRGVGTLTDAEASAAIAELDGAS